MSSSSGLIHGASNTELGAPAPVARITLRRDTAPSVRPPPQSAGIAAAEAIVLDIRTDLAAAEDEWRAFEQTADRSPFQRFDWLKQWQVHIGERRRTVPAIVFGRLPDQELLFILPLAVERRRGGRRLSWLGTERCDYNGPLLAPRFSDLALDWRALWPRIIDALRRTAGLRFDLVDLTKMPEWIGPQPNPMLVLPTVRNANDAHVATLGTDWEAFYRDKRSSSSRKVQRKQLNRMAEHGPVRFARPSERGDINQTIDTLIAQKKRALQRMGADDMFEIPGVREFYHGVATDPALRDLVDVSRLDIGEEVGAASIGLIDRGRYYLILSSYNDGPVSRHGPGRAHLLELLRAATEAGLTTFDFTIGNEPYKLDWCDIRVPLFDHLSAASLRGGLLRPTIAAGRGLRRSIRNNEKAWAILSSLRERMAGRRQADNPASDDDE